MKDMSDTKTNIFCISYMVELEEKQGQTVHETFVFWFVCVSAC